MVGANAQIDVSDIGGVQEILKQYRIDIGTMMEKLEEVVDERNHQEQQRAILAGEFKGYRQAVSELMKYIVEKTDTDY